MFLALWSLFFCVQRRVSGKKRRSITYLRVAGEFYDGCGEPSSAFALPVGQQEWRLRRRKLTTAISGREAWDLRKTLPKPAVPARSEYSIGERTLHPASIGPIWRAIMIRAFAKGALPDLTKDDLARLLAQVSGHSTRVGLNLDLFASGEDLAGIMDALRWKSPRMPLA